MPMLEEGMCLIRAKPAIEGRYFPAELGFPYCPVLTDIVSVPDARGSASVHRRVFLWRQHRTFFEP